MRLASSRPVQRSAAIERDMTTAPEAPRPSRKRIAMKVSMSGANTAPAVASEKTARLGRKRHPPPAHVGQGSDPELPGGEPPHGGREPELHQRGRRAEVGRLLRERRQIEVGHERTEGGEKRQKDDQKGAAVARRPRGFDCCHGSF